LSFQFALAISDKDSTINELAGFRRSLFAGDVDPDRLDYVARDLNAAGIAVHTYDLGRLFDACQVHKNPRSGHFEVRLTSGCLSSIEAFFLARFHLYRWVIYHHDVVRRNLSLQRIFDHLFNRDRRRGFSSKIIELADDIAIRSSAPESLDKYFGFVDGYLQEVLYNIYVDIQNATSSDSRELRKFLEVVLFRKRNMLLSLWKRVDGYKTFCEALFKGKEITLSPIKTFNDILQSRYDKYKGEQGKRGRLSLAIDLEAFINGYEGNKLGGRIYAYSFADFAAGPRDFDVWQYDQGVSVASISPILDSLDGAWENSPQLMLYCDSEDGVTPPQRVKKALDYAVSALRTLPEIQRIAEKST
jgi:hypothetical protein